MLNEDAHTPPPPRLGAALPVGFGDVIRQWAGQGRRFKELAILYKPRIASSLEFLQELSP